LKKIVLNILFSLVLFLVSCFSFSQDIHFSQFYNSPLNLNPGLIGQFNGDLRLVANQRTQWSSVTSPYTTYGISVDARSIFNSPISTGLSIYQDKAGDSDFSTLQIALGGAYTINLDSSHSLNIGAQPSFTQRNINYNKLQFDNQYNGNFYDSNLGNGETFTKNGRTYFNLHAGLNWNYHVAQRKEIEVGIAMHNILKPQQSFFNENIPLHQRFMANINGLFAISDKIDVLPHFIWQKQHKFQEMIFGGQGKYHLNNGNYKALYAGIWYRNSDASYFSIGIDYANLHVGISYDLNLSSLKVASNHRGGFEFALIYIFERYRPDLRRYKSCPDYI